MRTQMGKSADVLRQKSRKPELSVMPVLLALVLVMCLFAAGCSSKSSTTGEMVDFSPYGTEAETEALELETEPDETEPAETGPEYIEEYGVTFEATSATMYATTRVNVRTEPNTNCTIVGMLSDGDAVTVTGTSAEWIRVSYNGDPCYVSAVYLK